MTVQPTREQLRADVELGKDLTGTYYADEDADYYPAMERIFEAAPKLLDQLDQLEAELDSWMARAYEAEKRAWQAEKRIKAVRDLCDDADKRHASVLVVTKVRRAVEG